MLPKVPLRAEKGVYVPQDPGGQSLKSFLEESEVLKLVVTRREKGDRGNR